MKSGADAARPPVSQPVGGPCAATPIEGTHPAPGAAFDSPAPARARLGASATSMLPVTGAPGGLADEAAAVVALVGVGAAMAAGARRGRRGA